MSEDRISAPALSDEPAPIVASSSALPTVVSKKPNWIVIVCLAAGALAIFFIFLALMNAPASQSVAPINSVRQLTVQSTTSITTGENMAIEQKNVSDSSLLLRASLESSYNLFREALKSGDSVTALSLMDPASPLIPGSGDPFVPPEAVDDSVPSIVNCSFDFVAAKDGYAYLIEDGPIFVNAPDMHVVLGMKFLVNGSDYKFNSIILHNPESISPDAKTVSTQLQKSINAIKKQFGLPIFVSVQPIKEQLESASGETSSPFLSNSSAPIKFALAKQIDNRSVYIITQQPDDGSINFYAIGFYFEDGVWTHSNGIYDNYIFVSPMGQGADDIVAIKSKTETLADKTLAKAAKQSKPIKKTDTRTQMESLYRDFELALLYNKRADLAVLLSSDSLLDVSDNARWDALMASLNGHVDAYVPRLVDTTFISVNESNGTVMYFMSRGDQNEITLYGMAAKKENGQLKVYGYAAKPVHSAAEIDSVVAGLINRFTTY